MSYEIGTELEFDATDYTLDEPKVDWFPCVAVGKSLEGYPIIELSVEAYGWRCIFAVQDVALLRIPKIKNVWWSRTLIYPDGQPHTLNYKSPREYIDMAELPTGASWHGEAFSITVETDSK